MNKKYTKAVYMCNGEYGGKEYHFISLDDTIEINDLVVVETRGGYQVVKVTDFTDNSDVNVIRHVVQKLDLDTFEEKKKVAKKREEIEKAIEERIQKVKYLERLERLASADDLIAELLNELKELED